MAITQGTETISVTSEERTWRLEIFTEKGQQYSVRAHRETVRTDSEGNILSRERGVTVERTFSAIATEQFTIAGKAYTGGEVADALSAIADIRRQQDISRQEAGQ